MTFEEFQASAVISPDLTVDAPHYCEAFISLQSDMTTKSGRIYTGYWVIEDVTDAWPEDCRDRGKFYLILNNEEYISSDLPRLERLLFTFHKSS